MKKYEVWFDGSHDATVTLSETPKAGDIVRTPSYFSYQVVRIEHIDGKEGPRIIGTRVF